MQRERDSVEKEKTRSGNGERGVEKGRVGCRRGEG